GDGGLSHLGNFHGPAPEALHRGAAGPGGAADLSKPCLEPRPAHIETDEGPQPGEAGGAEQYVHVWRIRHHLDGTWVPAFHGSIPPFPSMVGGRRAPRPRGSFVSWLENVLLSGFQHVDFRLGRLLPGVADELVGALREKGERTVVLGQ